MRARGVTLGVTFPVTFLFLKLHPDSESVTFVTLILGKVTPKLRGKLHFSKPFLGAIAAKPHCFVTLFPAFQRKKDSIDFNRVTSFHTS